MKRLSDKEFYINPEKYTIHFITIVNPDGTIIVTSAIRTVISRDASEIEEQLVCLQYYLNSVMDDIYALKKNNKEEKIIEKMFQYANPDCIDDKYSELRENVRNIINQNNLPKTCLIYWTSNGLGVDLNSNIECGQYFEKFLRGEDVYVNLRCNQINRLKLAPTGWPSREKKFIEESENTAVLNFYKELIKKYDVIGSIIYHSCGGLVIGTRDLSELALGWCTNNGDHMSMYAVNVSIPKTLVKYLINYYAETEDNRICQSILRDILNTPVSPELLPPSKKGEILQQTESILGPYVLHDFFLYHFLRYGARPKKVKYLAINTFKDSYDENTIDKWLRFFIKRFFSQQFKRSCIPDGVKVGTISLSPRGDLRLPSDAESTDWIKELEEID